MKSIPVTDIVYTWGCSSYYGWGVIGLNLMLHWPSAALCAAPGPEGTLTNGDPRFPLLQQRIGQSVALRRKLLAPGAGENVVDVPVLCAPINPRFDRCPIAPDQHLTGCPTVAWVVFEDEAAARTYYPALHKYDAVWAASQWCADILSDCGVHCEVVHQGIDYALFNPTVRHCRNDGWFRVFSGGKCELRKGQDLVIQAFARFAQSHRDAKLVAAWGSPWPGLAAQFASTTVGSPPGADIGMPNFGAWCQNNGIPMHQIEIVPKTPNCALPAVYGSCDVGLFASRAEGGTNLMAMECMACGVPVIATDIGGHRDISIFVCEPTVDGIVDRLELFYDHQPMDHPGNMQRWDWPVRVDHMQQLLGAL